MAGAVMKEPAFIYVETEWWLLEKPAMTEQMIWMDAQQTAKGFDQDSVVQEEVKILQQFVPRFAVTGLMLVTKFVTTAIQMTEMDVQLIAEK